MKKILLSSVVAIALLTGCGEDKKAAETKPVVEAKVEEVKKVEPKVEMAKTPEEKLVDQVKESTSTVATKIAEESKKVAEIGTEAVKSVSEKVVAKTEEVTKVMTEKAVETKDKIEESINTIVATKTEAKDSTADAAKGKGLYLKCAGCHGQNGEKAALGKSKVIKGWEASKTVAALKGYKDGSYGGPMKGVMKSQVANLSDEEVDALGAFISSL
ncbi:c-type cytochrome [Arcobacter sp. LA11]|uniref:c-type cytochrome n=1 Tax=Arcobacter sp. LA11 TaxID=1898176 RepID=UPI000AB7E3E3|nr:c-type cytochrome [Arcobacter sp. LA11]